MQRLAEGLSGFALIQSAKICQIRVIRVPFRLAQRLQSPFPFSNYLYCAWRAGVSAGRGAISGSRRVA